MTYKGSNICHLVDVIDLLLFKWSNLAQGEKKDAWYKRFQGILSCLRGSFIGIATKCPLASIFRQSLSGNMNTGMLRALSWEHIKLKGLRHVICMLYVCQLLSEPKRKCRLWPICICTSVGFNTWMLKRKRECKFALKFCNNVWYWYAQSNIDIFGPAPTDFWGMKWDENFQTKSY